jgi:hypothetical protein
MRNLILALLVPVMLFITIFGVISADQKSDPGVSLQPGRKFAQVVALVDKTKSMTEDEFKRAKQILKTSVIQNCGPGDELILYTIGPVCERDGPVISAQLGMPEGLTRDSFEEVLSSRSGRRINELAGKVASHNSSLEEQRAVWSSKVDKIERLTDDGSDYTRQLEQAKSTLAVGNVAQVEKVLIVLGDFTEDLGIYGKCRNAPDWLKKPTPPTGSQAFREVRLELACTDNRAWVQNKNDEHWRSYFGNNKLTPKMFASVESGASLLSSNPMVELKRADLPSFWGAFWPYLLAILVCAVLFILIRNYDAGSDLKDDESSLNYDDGFDLNDESGRSRTIKRRSTRRKKSTKRRDSVPTQPGNNLRLPSPSARQPHETDP